MDYDPISILKNSIEHSKRKIHIDSKKESNNTDLEPNEFFVPKSASQVDSDDFRGNNEYVTTKNNFPSKKDCHQREYLSKFGVIMTIFKHEKVPPVEDVPFIDLNNFNINIIKNPINAFCNALLFKWGLDIETKLLVSNMKSYNSEIKRFVDTYENLKPLILQLCNDQLHNNILYKVTEIMHYCQAHKYASAHAAYLRLSIGNAPWPIGVTMVVIHERSAHDRLSNVAHVLNNEISRKWIQAIKRLLSISQKFFPPISASERMG